MGTAVGGSGVANKALKSASGYDVRDRNGTDTYGFSTLPAGFRYRGGGFACAGDCTYFWSASQLEDYSDAAYLTNLWSCAEGADLRGGKSGGYPVRCIKNSD